MKTCVLDPAHKDSIMLIDIQYVRPNKKDNIKDYIYIIWKDIDNDEKHLMAIEEPKVAIYFEKPEKRNHVHNKNYERKENLNKVVVKYKDILKAIVEDGGDDAKNFYNTMISTGQYKRLNELQAYPYVFGSDYDIRVLYRYEFKKQFTNDKIKHIRKGFGDIEVDSLESVGLPTPDLCPIDLVTIIDKDNKKSYTFALIGVDYTPSKAYLEYQESRKDTNNKNQTFYDREHENKVNLYKKRLDQQDYWSSHIDELKEEAHKMFDENYPGMDYNFFFYKDEKKMLVHLFQLINKLKMDTLEFWNISFDIPYIIGRLEHFGLNPADVICHPDFPSKQCYFKKDNHHFDIKNKNDYFHCSSYTVYLDQMELYAQIRKGEKELRSNQLSYIAHREIKDEKLDYSDNGNIKTISYKNYLQYILYNIKDVLLQVGIEDKTEDVDTLYVSAIENITPYDSVFKQTITLSAAQYEAYDKQNLVPGNNINGLFKEEEIVEKDDEDDEEEDSFEGALVGNPLLIDKFGETLYLEKTNNIFNYSVDEDMTAFYPNTIMSNNIDASTLIFKCIVPSDQYEPRGGKLKYHGITDSQMVSKNKDSFTEDIGKEIQDNFQTGNYLSFGYKWLNLPSVNDVYERLKKKLG